MKINKQNYKEILLDYIDNELSDKERKELEQYVETHAEIKDELLLLEQSKLSASEEVCFSNKKDLYASKNKISILWWKKAAIAAIAIGFFFFVGYMFLGIPHKTQHQQRVTQSRLPHISPESTLPPGNQKETLPSPNFPPKIASISQSKPASAAEEKTSATNQTTKNALSKNRDLKEEKYKNAKISLIKSIGTYPPVKKKTFIPKGALSPSGNKNEMAENKIPFPSSPPSKGQTMKNNKWKIKIIQPEDTSLTDKIYALQNKITHPIKSLNIKKIKIGNFSLQVN